MMRLTAPDLPAWFGTSWDGVYLLAEGWAVFVVFAIILRSLELIRPIEVQDTPKDKAEIWMEAKLAAGNMIAATLVFPLAAWFQTHLAAALGGGGWLVLEAHEPWLGWLLAGLYFLAALSVTGALITVFCVRETAAKLAPGVVPAGE